MCKCSIPKSTCASKLSACGGEWYSRLSFCCSETRWGRSPPGQNSITRDKGLSAEAWCVQKICTTQGCGASATSIAALASGDASNLLSICFTTQTLLVTVSLARHTTPKLPQPIVAPLSTTQFKVQPLGAVSW